MIKFIISLTMSILTVNTAIADDVYRWTEPESGKVLVSTKPPFYPIKEKRTAGRLPNGDMIELILDTNAPEVKALIEKRRVREAEQKRIAEEQARQRGAREAEQERIAAEQVKQKAAQETEEKRAAEQRWKEGAERIKKQERIAADKAEEQRRTEPEEIKNPPKKIVARTASKSSTVDADLIVSLINTMYGNVCHAEVGGFFSKTLKLDWTANTRKIHAIKILAEIGNVKAELYEDGVRYFQFPNDAGTYNVIDWKTGEKKSISERTLYYFSD